MPLIVDQIFGFLGFLLSALGLLVFGFAGGKFTLEAFQKSTWQVQVALALGFFIVLVGLANYTTPGSTGAFALGAGIAFLIGGANKKVDEEPKEQKKK